uniref:Membrane-spanning 4-domains subfamily A member 15 n=1 Tax=Naja naja TaxID=35670 RepID=A0A8C6X1P3_NAJNA
MASETTAVIPSNGVNILQIAPELPSVALQASEAIPYPQYGAQQLGISTSAPQQVPQGNPSEIFLKAEPKVLGAVEILIGVIHIGFGATLICLADSDWNWRLPPLGRDICKSCTMVVMAKGFNKNPVCSGAYLASHEYQIFLIISLFYFQ